MQAQRESIARNMQTELELRKQALCNWLFGMPGANSCPVCFGASISILLSGGLETLHCNDCGSEGPQSAE